MADGGVEARGQGGPADDLDHPSRAARAAALPTEREVPGALPCSAVQRHACVLC